MDDADVGKVIRNKKLTFFNLSWFNPNVPLKYVICFTVSLNCVLELCLSLKVPQLF